MRINIRNSVSSKTVRKLKYIMVHDHDELFLQSAVFQLHKLIQTDLFI